MAPKTDLFFMADVVAVSELTPLTGGWIREVYTFPGRPDLLIKVKNTRARNKRRKLAKRLAWRLFADAKYRNTLNEIQCELKVAMKIGAQIKRSPLPRMLGVVQTDRGPGVVVERISGDDDGLARHLAKICRQDELTEAMLEQLNQFVAKMYDFQIVARDLNARNIVYGRRGAEPGFFLVDGYGEHNLVPLRSLWRRLNDRSLNRRFGILAGKLGLVWDNNRRAFGFS